MMINAQLPPYKIKLNNSSEYSKPHGLYQFSKQRGVTVLLIYLAMRVQRLGGSYVNYVDFTDVYNVTLLTV